MTTRVPGHALRNEGAPFDLMRVRINKTGTGGEGRALCSCGELSRWLPSAPARQAWHRMHKRLVLEERQR